MVVIGWSDSELVASCVVVVSRSLRSKLQSDACHSRQVDLKNHACWKSMPFLGTLLQQKVEVLT